VIEVKKIAALRIAQGYLTEDEMRETVEWAALQGAAPTIKDVAEAMSDGKRLRREYLQLVTRVVGEYQGAEK
jgi:hypothetical protein